MRQISLSLARLLAAVLSTGWLMAAPACLSATVRDLPPDIARFYDGGLYRQATEALDSAIGREPQESSLHFWQGRCFFELRDYNKAISSLERAIALEPGRSDYHYWLGKSYGRKAEETSRFTPFSAFSLAHKTHREFETAVRLDENNLEAQRDLIRYLMTAPGIAGGSEEEAQQRIHALAAVDSTEAALAQAGLFDSRKKFDEADQEYRKVLDNKPDRIGVYFEIAEYYRDRGDAARMSEATEAGALLAPSDRRLDYYRGIVLVLMNEAMEAEKHLSHYLDTVPDNDNVPSHSSAHEWLGRLYEDQGRLDRAEQEYHAALNLDPHNKQARDALKALQHRRH
ncbi:MAG TPA: tetratricopeptide repeat protein [Bryobacteraceae bacterium]|nr:tetratricopeptide repeat protein [Bryobacteraceae bacterium]